MKIAVCYLLFATVMAATTNAPENSPAFLNVPGVAFFEEDLQTGVNSYYSYTYYTHFDPKSLNYKS